MLMPNLPISVDEECRASETKSTNVEPMAKLLVIDKINGQRNNLTIGAASLVQVQDTF